MLAEPLSSSEVAVLHTKSLLRSAARALFRRVRRDRRRVAGEYDGGHWARMLQSRAWERYASLEEFLVGPGTHTITAKVDGRPTRLAQRDYYRYRIGAAAELLRKHLGGTSALVELGSGFGMNVFAMTLAFPDRHLAGFDISPNGVTAAREIAAHFGVAERARFDLLDLTDAAHPGWSGLTGRDCFSFFCLEQIPYDVEAVVCNVARARPRRVLHVEPTVELLDLKRPTDWANYAYVKSVDYQTELFGVLRRLDRAGKLRLLATGRAGFAPTLQNDGFTAVWEPR